jgi:hypothetical protein
MPVTILPAALAFIVVAALRLGRDVFRPRGSCCWPPARSWAPPSST